MTLVSAPEIEVFINEYLDSMEKLTSKFGDYRNEFFPECVVFPYSIVVTISRTHGVAIDFVQRASRRSITVRQEDRRIEDVYSLTFSDRFLERAFIRNVGSNNILQNLNFITKDFYEKYESIIKVLSKASNLIMARAGRFVRVDSGDLRLIDVGLACIKNGKDFIKDVKYLWIFGNNTSEYWKTENAKKRALDDYRMYVEKVLSNFPLFRLERVSTQYEELLGKKGISEEDLQRFFDKRKNWLLLDVTAKNVTPKARLGAEFVVDFIVERPDFQYTLVEIEKPDVKLYTKDGDPTKELKHATRQMEDYQRWINEHPSYICEKLPNMYSPYGLVIIGMSSQLTRNEKKRLEQSNVTTRGKYEIMTFDGLLAKAKSLLKNLS